MRRLFGHTFLLRELIRRDFQGRYAGSFLGFLWSFVQPLWQLLLFSFVFSTVMDIRPTDSGTERFWVFLFCGLLPWLAVQEGITRGATAVTDNSGLVKKLQFPSQVLVVAVVLTALLHEAIAAGLFVAALGLIGELSWSSLPWLLVAVPLQVALVLGLALALAATHVFFRDTVQILGMVMAAWFYLTPIVYPLSMVPEPYDGWIAANPLTTLAGLYRRAFLGGTTGTTPEAIGWLAATAVGILALGIWLFRRLRPSFVDEI
ncbi:MAG TPA: ABC transporter permease [Thermoanaerobaculia bacterium]|nr:ABC transporter permease [Thermoanaerobaculia bacterium]